MKPLSILVLALAACSRERQSFEDLQRAAYRELQRGDLHAAQAHAEKGRQRAHEVWETVWEHRFQVLHAEILVDQRRYAEALTLLEADSRPGNPPDSLSVRALMTRGRAGCQSGSNAEAFRRAEADLEQASRVAAGLGSSELSGEVAVRRGTCALLRGDTPTAETLFREAFDAARREKQPFLEAKAAGSLGFLRARARRYDDAADWFERALALVSALEADLLAVRLLGNLGWCYYELGDYDRALAFLTRAESVAEARGQKGDLQIALTTIGNARYRLGDLTEAGNYYRRALAIAQELGDKKPVAELVSNLGHVALEQGLYEEAENFIREALRIKTEMGDLPSKQHSLLAEGKIWAGRGNYGKAEALYRSVMDSPDSKPELIWEARGAEARLLVKTRRPAQADAEFRKAFAIMEQSRAELRKAEHRISFFSSLRQFYDSYVDFLVEGGRVEQALTVADESRARSLREKLAIDGRQAAGSAERLQGAARALDAVILSYWVAPGRSFLWVVTPGKVSIHVLPEEAEIRKHVGAHQALILRSRDPLREGAPEAEWLYRNLVGPAAASIPKGSRVVFIPDGPLHQINPETLIVPSPERRYWVEDVTLATAPSLALLAGGKAGRAIHPAHGILIIGDPVSATAEFQPLPNATKEVQRIAEQFTPQEKTVYSGAQADPTVYKAADPGRFSFIHFAAHAKANPEVPLDSAVILSAKNESYKLYARDIVGIPLGADLVTLSACRSAGSRTYAGEGLVGLAWAFLSAGAGNVVAGLWNVEDASTSELMAELYRGLKRGLQPAEALRDAKLRLLRSDTAYRKPYYWAPFMTYTARRAESSSAGRRAAR